MTLEASRRWLNWPLGLLLALCVARFWLLPLNTSFWVDETVTAFVVRQGGDAPSLAIAPQVPQSIYYALPAAVQSEAGFSEAGYRLPSVLAMSVALFFCARIGMRLIHPDCGWLIVLSSFLLRGFSDAATDARPYAFGLCVASLSVWALIRWLDRAGWVDGALFLLSAALLWRTHLVYWPFYLVFASYTAARLWRRDTPVNWKAASGLFVLLGLLLVPVAWNALSLAREASAHVIQPPPGFRQLQYALKFGLLLGTLPAAWILSRMLRHTPSTLCMTSGVLLLGWWFVHPVTLFAYSVETGNSVFLPRYLSLAWPGILLGTAFLLARYLPASFWRPLAVLAGVWALAQSAGLPLDAPAHRSDWRGAAQAIAALHDPDVPVICPSPFVEARAPEWRPDYVLPGFLYAHLAAYPLAGRPLLLPYAPSEEGLRYARGLSSTRLPAAGRFVIYGGDRNVEFWQRWFSQRPELQGWTARQLGAFGDVKAVLFERSNKPVSPASGHISENLPPA
ncbi:hypothetical protein [Paludibaculum fermentans]|uniref:Glycosyltransferase RgtA/B/C/D-like domain-containing protein n=1 Tax=Paludibaculum fermentans TaxID=1473598 RepID=A0A7S7SJ13_PALFE|nr:hypothetical protein [Paludibaculum fermentans]QOY86694.1 hypothetical protein IRI77_28485 [Paludibaculum fermentans]